MIAVSPQALSHLIKYIQFMLIVAFEKSNVNGGHFKHSGDGYCDFECNAFYMLLLTCTTRGLSSSFENITLLALIHVFLFVLLKMWE